MNRFRSSAPGDAGSVERRPNPGVYVYAGTGEERLSFLGTHQSQIGNLPGTVALGGDGCWTFALEYNSFHRQSWSRCTVNGRFVEHGNSTDQKFDFGVMSQSEHTEVVCRPPIVLADPANAPGDHDPVRCTGHSQTTQATMNQRGRVTFVGSATVVVSGRRVAALHVKQDFAITGDQTGSTHEELWIARDSGLPLRERRTIRVVSPAPAPLFHVTYSERGGWHLTSMTPRT
ncbi:MAG: hypothetical protein ACXVKA_11140 [Acidimicrobiia bacterium]